MGGTRNRTTAGLRRAASRALLFGGRRRLTGWRPVCRSRQPHLCLSEASEWAARMRSQQAGFSVAEEEAGGRWTGNSEALVIELAHASRAGINQNAKSRPNPIGRRRDAHASEKKIERPMSAHPHLLFVFASVKKVVFWRAKKVDIFDCARGSSRVPRSCQTGTSAKVCVPKTRKKSGAGEPTPNSQHHWTGPDCFLRPPPTRPPFPRPLFCHHCSFITRHSVPSSHSRSLISNTVSRVSGSPPSPVPHINTIPTRTSTRSVPITNGASGAEAIDNRRLILVDLLPLSPARHHMHRLA